MKQPTHEEQLQAITEWLAEVQQDRVWLAKQLGVSIGAVNGWFSLASKRVIPPPTWKLISLMFRDRSLGEPRFTFQEVDKIKTAMQSASYHSFPEFARDAVIVSTEAELKKLGELPGIHLKVADAPTDYFANNSDRSETDEEPGEEDKSA